MGNKVRLGESQIEVTRACIGTMTWGKQTSAAAAHELLDIAIKSKGVNFVDTSELYPLPCTTSTYGESERILGSWLAKNPDWRDRIIVGTKVVGYMKSTFIPSARQLDLTNNPQSTKRMPSRLNKDQIIQACNASLRRLQTSYIDVFYLHWPDRYVPMFGKRVFDRNHVREYTPFDQVVQAVQVLLQEGKIRSWGLSNETAFGICELVHEARRVGVPPPVCIQNCFNLLDRSFETDSVSEAAFYHKLNLIAFSPLSGGALTGKYLNQVEPPNGSRFASFDKFDKQFNNERVRAAIAEYARVAHSEDCALPDFALRWLFSRPCMQDGVVILGASRVEQFLYNLEALSKGDLRDECLQAVDAVYLSHKDPVNGL